MYSLYDLNSRGIHFLESHDGGQLDTLKHHRPVEVVKDTFLSDLEPGPWKLGSKDLETIFNDYYHNEYEARTKSAVAEINLDPRDNLFSLNNEELQYQLGTSSDNTYWTDFYKQLQGEQ